MFPALMRIAAAAAAMSGGGQRAFSLSGGGGGGGGSAGRLRLGTHAANAINTAQYANAALDRWIPGTTLTFQVTAQGGPRTPPKNVLHTALAIAFGMPKERRFASFNISVAVDHRANTVTVNYSIGSLALVDLIAGSIEEFKKLDLADKAKVAVLGPLGFIAVRIANDVANGKKLEDVLGDLNGALHQKSGAGQMWTMAVEDIRAGAPPSSLGLGNDADRQRIIGAPLIGGMVNRPGQENALMLTTNPLRHNIPFERSNPQPPAPVATGADDLRSLMVQVLADPGIRPPAPLTHVGPPGKKELPTDG